MGEPNSSDSWKKLVIAKSNDQWVSMSNLKGERADGGDTAGNFSLDYDHTPYNISVKTEVIDVPRNPDWEASDPLAIQQPNTDLLIEKKRKRESSEDRAARLSKMSAYAAQRLANETAEQRATRLKRMSEYAARRLANETSEQRAKRLARMSAYAAKRLAQETPEQRSARLARMSAYAAKRHALKKMTVESNNDSE